MNKAQKTIVAIALFAMALVAFFPPRDKPASDVLSGAILGNWLQDERVLWPQLVVAWAFIGLCAGGAIMLIAADVKTTSLATPQQPAGDPAATTGASPPPTSIRAS